MKKRIEWIDLLKGLAIIMVMIGHTYFPNWLKIWVYSVDIPLFFFLSGYTFSINKFENIKECMVYKAKTLLFPGMILSAICYLITLIIEFNISMKSIILGLIFQLRGQQLCGLWFTTCLFVSEVIFYQLVKVLKEDKKINITIVLISIMAYIYIRFIGKILPWCIDVCGIAIFFINLGRIVKNKYNLEGKSIIKGIALIILGIALCILNYEISSYHVDLYANKIGEYVLFVASSVCQILGFLIMIQKKSNKLLNYIGRNSLIFYAFHGTFYLIYDKFLILFNLSSDQTYMGIIYLCLTVILMIPIVSIFNNYLYKLIGKKKIGV